MNFEIILAMLYFFVNIFILAHLTKKIPLSNYNETFFCVVTQLVNL